MLGNCSKGSHTITGGSKYSAEFIGCFSELVGRLGVKTSGPCGFCSYNFETFTKYSLTSLSNFVWILSWLRHNIFVKQNGGYSTSSPGTSGHNSVTSGSVAVIIELFIYFRLCQCHSEFEREYLSREVSYFFTSGSVTVNLNYFSTSGSVTVSQ